MKNSGDLFSRRSVTNFIECFSMSLDRLFYYFLPIVWRGELWGRAQFLFGQHFSEAEWVNQTCCVKWGRSRECWWHIISINCQILWRAATTFRKLALGIWKWKLNSANTRGNSHPTTRICHGNPLWSGNEAATTFITTEETKAIWSNHTTQGLQYF